MKDNHLSYRPSAEGAEKIEQLRAKIIELDDFLDEAIGTPTASETVDVPAVLRTKALAKTALEEARMWAVTAIVRANNIGPNDFGTVSGSSEKKAA